MPHQFGDGTLNIRSFMPSILWVSLQNADVNFVSQSETIVSGNPCSHTTSFMYRHMSCDALMVMLTGTRCTIDMSLHSMTHM